MLSRENMFTNEVLDKMLENFAIFNIIGDIKHFGSKIGNKQKAEFFPMLLNDSEKLNFITFTVKKMKSSAVKSLAEFKRKFAEKQAENILEEKNRISEFKKKLETIEFYVENLEEVFYKCCPNQGIFVLSHNDAHLINIMHTENIDKVYLFDHEYSCYNFMGFDIANYIIESLFYLADQQHPYYRYHREELKTLLNDNFFCAYLKFFELIKNKYYNEFKDYPEFEKLLELAKTKEYYMQVMSLSSVMWSIFAVIYLDFESVWDKSAYDYFNFAIDRLAIYHEFLKFELKH
jgi:thiamine kinase-like enzyme